MSVICQLRGVTKRLGNRTVLEDVNLSVTAGEMVAITGPSGSGKSTLLNIAGLLETVDAGDVALFGRKAPKVGSRASTRLLRGRLGYLFQNYALIDTATVEANLRVAQRYARGSGRTARERAIQAVGLQGREQQNVFELSGGEQQRLAVARLLLKPCDLILADEPTGSLDAGNRDLVMQLLHRLAEQGKTVIIVTHDDVVASQCHRTIHLGAASAPPVPFRGARRATGTTAPPAQTAAAKA